MQDLSLDFLKLMNYPKEWRDLGMYPEVLESIQRADYEPGSEKASEHFRFGAFCWWEVNVKTAQQLKNLFILARADPDKGMAENVLDRLRSHGLYSPEIEE